MSPKGIVGDQSFIIAQAPELESLARCANSSLVLDDLANLLNAVGVAVLKAHSTGSLCDTSDKSLIAVIDERFGQLIPAIKESTTASVVQANQHNLRQAFMEARSSDPLSEKLSMVAADVTHLRQAADARAVAMAASSIKGREAESTLMEALGRVLTVTNG